jgi:hypothetical protein
LGREVTGFFLDVYALNLMYGCLEMQDLSYTFVHIIIESSYLRGLLKGIMPGI